MPVKKLCSLLILPGIMASAVAQVKQDTIIIPAKKKTEPTHYAVHNGYQTLFSHQVTGAVGSLRGESLGNLVVPNIKAALQGKVAGLYTVQANGMPASEVAMRIRGISSIYSETDPLIIIDGVPAYAGPRDFPASGIGGSWGSTFNPLNDINPMDIQHIDVLKDASATAIYGSRGANGVIVITTKAATVNKSEVNLDYYNGFTDITNRRDMLDGPGYLQALDRSWQNAGNTGDAPLNIPGLTSDLAKATNTDHMGALLQQGRVQQLSLSSSYGTARSSFYFSGGFRDEKGVLSGNNYRRYTGKVKMNNQLTKRLSIGVNIGVNFADYFNMPVGYSNGGGFNAAQLNLPVMPFYNPDGSYFYPGDPSVYNLPGTNVRSFLNKMDFDNEEHTRRISIAANIGYQLLPGLDLRFDAAMDQWQQTRRDYLSRRLRYGSVGAGAGREGAPIAYAAYEKYTKNVYNMLGTLNFKRGKGENMINAVAGTEFFYTDNPVFFGEGESFVSDFLRQPAAAAYRNQNTALGLTTNVNAVLGFFANGNYVYRERYVLNATVRVDAGSRFGKDAKYQVYPALSAGYWLKKNLKLRAGYGWSGNYGIGNYSNLERWGLGSTSRYMQQAGVQALALGSASLKPERVEEINIGADFTFLDNRIGGSVDLYNRTTHDMVLRFPGPLSSGVIDPGLLLNAGKMRNRGIELSLNTRNMVGAFNWSTDLSIAYNKNKILDLAGLSPDLVTAHPNIINVVGKSTGAYYLAEYAGIDKTTGQELIYDQDRNIVPATSAAQVDAARVPLNKSAAPKFFGGINNSFSYRSFDLSVFCTFSYGNYVLDEGERSLSYVRGRNNMVADAANSWTPQNMNASFPRLQYNDPIANSNTTRFLHDASYLRVKNITLGYSFKKSIRKIKFLKDLRVYASAQNLFTITGFKGWDPEVSGNYTTGIERSQHLGITYMDVPQVKSIVAGINVKL